MKGDPMSEERENITKYAEALMFKLQKFDPVLTTKYVKEKGKLFCARRLQWVHDFVCISRQDKREDGCIRCKQGELVRNLKLKSNAPGKWRGFRAN